MLWKVFLPVCLMAHISIQDFVTLGPDTDDEVRSLFTNVKPTIRSLQVTSDIKYRYATTLVSSRVINPSNQAAEASFSITLPESAFISGFLMEVEGKVYKAYVKEKEEAKAIYNQAVSSGQSAGHVALKARDSSEFTVAVNIEAHGKITFNLTYEQLLSRTLGIYSNVISINPQQIVQDLSVTVNIEEPTQITDVFVPEIQTTNDILQDFLKENKLAKIEEVSPNHTRIVWAPTPEEQKSLNSFGISGQFIVNYDVSREQNPQQILVDEGYFVHFFAPENLPKLRKHVVFVLDYSSSMYGNKLHQLKDSMNKILSDLAPEDYFSIVIFHSNVQVWSPQRTSNTRCLSLFNDGCFQQTSESPNMDFVVKASSNNIELARSYINSISDLGMTNIMGGLKTGLDLVKVGSEEWLNESDPPQPVIIFLTDGQPNVGESNTERIIEKTTDMNTKKYPIYSLAFGYGADFKFLRKLSLSNNGFARNIYEAADASAQLENFYRTVASPLLSNVTFSYLSGQVDSSSHTKLDFPVYFNGSEIIVAGKIDRSTIQDNKIIGELSGISANGLKKYPIVVDLELSHQEPQIRTLGHLEKMWAYLTIQQSLDKAELLDNEEEKHNKEVKALDLALKYSFVTRLTSLVVVKPNETASAVNPNKVRPVSGSDRSSIHYNSPGYAAAPMLSPRSGSISYRIPLMGQQKIYQRSGLSLSGAKGGRISAPPSLIDPNYQQSLLRSPNTHFSAKISDRLMGGGITASVLPTAMPTTLPACGGEMTSEQGTIASPNFPDDYPNNVVCEWLIKTSVGNKVTLTFINFNLEHSEQCNTDYVEIRAGSNSGTLLGVFCGTVMPPNITAQQTLWLRFHSDPFFTGPGFKAEYNIIS